MAITIVRGTSDDTLDQIIAVLGKYQADHAAAQIDLYRENSVTVRVRVIDPDLAAVRWVERHDLFWKYFDGVPDDIQADIYPLVMLAPGEVAKSMGNLDFENPNPALAHF